MLIVKCTVGPDGDDAERCNQALTVAGTAALSGVSVSLWLTGDATWLATEGVAERFVLPHATAAQELLQAVADTGQITVCGQCAKRRDVVAEDLVFGARIAGAAVFVQETMAPEAKALVY